MRKDMKQVLTERPRRGHQNCYRDVRRRENRGDYDLLPSKVGMRRPYVANHGDNAKEFSDLLGPLHRFLWSCVGRKWDDVWSEICSQLSNNTVDSHLKGHVVSYVEVNTFRRDDKIYVFSAYSGVREPLGLYVDPDTGLLCGTSRDRPGWKYKADIVYLEGRAYKLKDGVHQPCRDHHKAGRHPRMILADGREAAKFGGIWYWVVFKDYEPPAWAENVGSVGTYDLFGNHVTAGRYRADKRQMSSLDLRRHGLTNND